jgi:hypothetical protein
VTKNRQETGNRWQLLGTFIMPPGQIHRVGSKRGQSGFILRAIVDCAIPEVARLSDHMYHDSYPTDAGRDDALEKSMRVMRNHKEKCSCHSK